MASSHPPQKVQPDYLCVFHVCLTVCLIFLHREKITVFARTMYCKCSFASSKMCCHVVVLCCCAVLSVLCCCVVVLCCCAVLFVLCCCAVVLHCIAVLLCCVVCAVLCCLCCVVFVMLLCCIVCAFIAVPCYVYRLAVLCSLCYVLSQDWTVLIPLVSFPPALMLSHMALSFVLCFCVTSTHQCQWFVT